MVLVEQSDLPQTLSLPRSESELTEIFGEEVCTFSHSFTSENGTFLQETFFIRRKKQPYSDTVSFSVLDQYGDRVFLCEGTLDQHNMFYARSADSAKIKNAAKVYLANPESGQRNAKVCEHNQFSSRYISHIGAHSIANIIIGLKMGWNSGDDLETGGKLLHMYIQQHFSPQILTIPPSTAERRNYYILTPNPNC